MELEAPQTQAEAGQQAQACDEVELELLVRNLFCVYVRGWFKWGVAWLCLRRVWVRQRADEHLALGEWWPLGATPRPALSGCGESPGSGDDLSPGWRRTLAYRESSHGRQETCSETQGNTVTSTSPATGADSAPNPPDYAPSRDHGHLA